MAKKSTSKLFNEEETVQEASNVDVDLDLSAIRKKRIRINHDDSKILELNINDINVANRLQTAYAKLTSLMDEISNTIKPESDDGTPLSDGESEQILEALNVIDQKMREQVDYIFDAPVSEVCASDGSMWDPFEGAFRYEHIISAIAALYESNLSSEFETLRKRVEPKLQNHKRALSKYHK